MASKKTAPDATQRESSSRTAREMRALTDPRWYPVALGDIAPGDTVRFVGPRGRVVEGPVEELPGGDLWCQFVTIDGHLARQLHARGRNFERRGLPPLGPAARAILRAVDTLSPDEFLAISLKFSDLSFDDICTMLSRCRSVSDADWSAIWIHTKRRVEARGKALGPHARRFAEPVGDTVGAAVLGAALGSLSRPVRRTLVRPWEQFLLHSQRRC